MHTSVHRPPGKRQKLIRSLFRGRRFWSPTRRQAFSIVSDFVGFGGQKRRHAFSIDKHERLADDNQQFRPIPERAMCVSIMAGPDLSSMDMADDEQARASLAPNRIDRGHSAAWNRSASEMCHSQAATDVTIVWHFVVFAVHGTRQAVSIVSQSADFDPSSGDTQRNLPSIFGLRDATCTEVCIYYGTQCLSHI
jgi:hypothetical protein